MADGDAKLLSEVTSFLAQGPTPLPLEEVDSEQLLAETDALLKSLDKADSEAEKRAIEKIRAGQRRDAYRMRQKAERASLRQQDAELTRRLDQLQAAKAAVKTQSTPEDSITLSAWRAIANSQYGNRLEAEALQKRLQAAVDSRAVLIQDLERVLRKRVREVDSTGGDLNSAEKRARLDSKEAKLYQSYLDNLDVLYAQSDEIFAAVGTTPTPGGIVGDVPTRKLDGDTEYFETIGVGRFPFSFQRTCDAVWELAAVPHRQLDRRVYDGLPDPENSIAVRFCSPCPRETGEVVTLRTYNVSRRYREASRWVLVWRALSEADGEFTGMHSDETGWCIVHDSASGLDSPSEATTTLVQTCVRFVPMHFGGDKVDTELKVDQFAQLLVETGQEDTREIAHMMERLILDDALATDGVAIDEQGELTMKPRQQEDLGAAPFSFFGRR
ncbi:hypothetical protein BBJ28_00026691 [Nothophytophthora sp. Chile5]|nr:hypothetical protein BBJ28_00026691 [Nothophytophthora sp. Chile5]